MRDDDGDRPAEHYPATQQNLFGRVMLSGSPDYACAVDAISPTHAILITQAKGRMGDFVVAYIDKIGRIRGDITHISTRGFSIAIRCTALKRQRLAAQLGWIGSESTLSQDGQLGSVILSNVSIVLYCENLRGDKFRASLVSISKIEMEAVVDFDVAVGSMISVGNTLCTIMWRDDKLVRFSFCFPKNEREIFAFLSAVTSLQGSLEEG